MRNRLNYIRSGTDHREILVMLHGFMGSATSFNLLADKLSQYVQIIAFDLPGHGNSRFSRIDPKGKLRSFNQVAELVLDELVQMGIKQFNLYGYSMGGRIAQNICLLAPDHIRQLILESASFGIEDSVEREKRYQSDKNLLADVHTPDEFSMFVKKWHQLPLFCTLADTGILDGLIRSKKENPIDELKKALYLMSVGNQPFWPEKLHQTQIPIYYFYGEEDQRYKQTALATQKLIPGMRIRSFQNASHNIHIQFPDLIITAISKIISQIPD